MERELTLMQMNDSHGYVDRHVELFWEGGKAVYRPAGGYSAIATVLKQVRKERGAGVLFFDNGDTFHGTHAAVTTKGEGLAPILRQLSLTAMTGHWDFAYGPDQLKRLAGMAGYPMLAANVFDSSGRSGFPSHLVTEAGGLRVGIVGLASNIIDKAMPPHFSEGLSFTLGKEVLPELIDRLRRSERADLVVVLSHLGFPQDMKLAEDVPGIDVLLSGHTHNRLAAPARVGDTVLIQSGSHGSFLGRLDLRVDEGRVTNVQHQLITVGEDIPQDGEVQALVEELLAPHREELGRVIGETRTGLNRNTFLEATMDNLLLDSLLDATGAPIAFSNGWRYGAPVPPGPITVNDLYNIIPVNPPVSTVDLKGEEIRALLEESLEHTLARDPYDQMGGYLKRVAGLTLLAKAENPRGQRVQEIFVGDKRLQDSAVYHAAFVTEQGVAGKYGTNRKATEVRAVEALEQYLKKHRTVEPELRGAVLLI